MSKEDLIKRIENNHRYHPATKQTAPLFEQVRNATEFCAKALINLCPESRELSLALTAMEEAMFWANAAIARQNPVEEK